MNNTIDESAVGSLELEFYRKALKGELSWGGGNTTPTHTHDNKDVLDDIEEPFTTAQKNKLDNLSERFRGVYASAALAEIDTPLPVGGYYFLNSTTATIWTYRYDVLAPNGIGLWEDTGVSSAGDMLSSNYDPTNIGGDVYDRGNHTGSQPQSSVDNLETDLADITDRLTTVEDSIPESSMEGISLVNSGVSYLAMGTDGTVDLATLQSGVVLDNSVNSDFTLQAVISSNTVAFRITSRTPYYGKLTGNRYVTTRSNGEVTGDDGTAVYAAARRWVSGTAGHATAQTVTTAAFDREDCVSLTAQIGRGGGSVHNFSFTVQIELSPVDSAAMNVQVIPLLGKMQS